MNDWWSNLRNGPCYIIAEAGVNHDGNLDKARRLVAAAANAGANAVKFQTFRADEISIPGLHRDMLKRLEMPHAWHIELQKQAAELGIDFLSSPFDLESARFLWSIGVPALKIGSGELTNLRLLDRLADFHMPLILSTGMADMGECLDAKRAIDVPHIAWLHCVSAYPARAEDYNLRCMDAMRHQLGPVVGLSDHTMGDLVALAAVARGSHIVEKHLTLCFEDDGPDHSMSMEPGEFALMVQRIRQLEEALGDGLKMPTESEKLTMPRARRKIGNDGFKRYV